jgi:heterodisulfide reductase subunit A
MEKCIACGDCAAKCPTKVPDEHNEGLGPRKAIYVKYSQAVPLKYAIDKERCRILGLGKKCGICEKKCPTGAINFNDKEKEVVVHVGSIVLAPGFKPYDARVRGELGLGRWKNVVSGLQFERILSPSGPYQGHVKRPSDNGHPKKVAWVQCVGSRDPHNANPWCSSVCCMYATKQAVIAKEHDAHIEPTIFYMEMRAYGKDFDKYVERAKNQFGVRYQRSMISAIREEASTGNLLIRYADEQGKLIDETFDMAVLSVGLDVPPETIVLAEQMGIELNSNHFNKTSSFKPVATSKPGIYACGAFSGPKDIPVSVMEASAAACAAAANLSEVRNTLTVKQAAPELRNIAGEPPRVGVYVCNCGINIGGVVKVPELVEYAKKLPFVVYTEESMFTCSQDTQDRIKESIVKNGINRVVVAACTPRTHEPLFQDTMQSAGLNKYLFEMANIRNQNSWVHSDTPRRATAKAKDLVRMAVAKAALLEPLSQTVLGNTKRALVVGGGVAGMNASNELARQGYEVDLVERSDHLGGHALKLFQTTKSELVAPYVEELAKSVTTEPLIKVHLNSVISKVEGFVGNFKTTLRKVGNGKESVVVEHGVAIIATGASELKPSEYLYGQNPRVMTQTEFDKLFKDKSPAFKEMKNVVFIQCVGSREKERPYCSKVCCAHSVQSAIEIKKRNPKANVVIINRDIRTYGELEDLYKEARDLGVFFAKYDESKKPLVEDNGSTVRVTFTDHILQKSIKVNADYLVLASAIVSNKEEELAQQFKVPMDADGWFLEAHQKLRPVDFATDGVFLCGLAHYPKAIDETIAQAQAAVARAVTVLSMDSIVVGGSISNIEKRRCAGCGVCINLCPFQAIKFDDKEKAEVNVALCKGCGVCVTSCRSGAPDLKGFTTGEIMAQLDALEGVF